MNAGKFEDIMNGKGSSGAPSPERLGSKLALPFLLLALAACATTPDGAPYEPNASMGMLIARQSCADCHQTGRTGESPNSQAIAFREIVNRPGITSDSLAAWLKGGHNYPAEMGFSLEPHQVDSLVAYMMRQQAGGSASQS